jgi:hypothetical protein
MSTGTNESEETVNDRNSPGTLAPGHAAVPAKPEANGPEPVAGHPVTAPETYPAEGDPTIAPGPAEEEDRREHDDRGLTTDAGSSD